jgi:hypothetical protein
VASQAFDCPIAAEQNHTIRGRRGFDFETDFQELEGLGGVRYT